LAEVLVNVGDAVKSGQVLARFADEGVQADVAQARAGVNEASAQSGEATANADRVRALQGTGTFSGQQASQYLTAEQTARARVESAKAALASQVLRLKYTQVLAPDAGVISARTATVGAVVGNGTELFRLIRQGRLEWRAEVTAAELGRLVVGTRVNITAGSGAPLQGRVRMVAPTVDPQTRTGLVYVDLTTSPQGAAGAVKPGMFARGEFELGNSQALTVPQQAVVVRDGFSYAFRLNADQRVSQVKLTTGRRVGERVEVLEGISPDAVLVASGAGFLNDGDLVKVVPAEKSVSNSPLAPASQAVPATK
jgi:RND family efflux transporter MFP subunit